jgi:hypothetical protein
MGSVSAFIQRKTKPDTDPDPIMLLLSAYLANRICRDLTTKRKLPIYKCGVVRCDLLELRCFSPDAC